MSLTIGNQKIVIPEDVNTELLKVEGELDDLRAKITLAKFLRANLGFSIRQFFKFDLLPLQEIILRAILLKDNSLVVAARGFSKSTLISILSLYMPIFYPGSRGVLIATNFRSSRRILEESEKFIKRREGELLRHCFTEELKRSNDMYRIRISETNSEVTAYPLSCGEGLRGTRASWVVIDEGLLISKDIQENILRPFLTVKANAAEEMIIRKEEDNLIAKGVITEADRISFPRNKFIIFSSASYKFEYLYNIFSNYIDNIMNPPQDENPPTYFVMRASYKSLPEDSFLDYNQINSAKASDGENTDYFKKEYLALFSDASSSYFNVKKMHDCTLKVGEEPTTQVYGERGSEYLLSIDPSYAISKDSDYFAMSVFQLQPQSRSIIQVHTYGRAGGELREHFEYLVYLLKNFNIVFIILDASGSEFVYGFNESTIAKEHQLQLSFIDADFEADNYQENLAKTKQQYNQTGGKILYGQTFASQPIRRMNEHLQNQINAEKVWFASPVGANESAFRKYSSCKLPFKFKDNNDKEYQIDDFIHDQDYWIRETKAQTALIEVKTTSLGTLQYGLPLSMKRSDSKNRIRKDLYTTLLLGSYGAKIWYDITFTEKLPEGMATFVPRLV